MTAGKTGGTDVRLWFLAASLAAIVAINAVMAFALNRYVAERILLREGAVAQELLTSIVSAEGTAASLFDKPMPSPALASFSNHVRSLPGLLRANIYSPDGFIRFSTQANLIGLKFENPELAEGFAGVITAKLEVLSDERKDEHMAINLPFGESVVEAYIPILDDAGKAVAVVEFYKSPKLVHEVTAQINRIVWTCSAVGGLALFVALYGAFVLLERRRTGAA